MLEHNDRVGSGGVGDYYTLFSRLLADEVFVAGKLTVANERGCFYLVRAKRAVTLKHDNAVSRIVRNGYGLTGVNG